jgi:hypothetical protein
VGYTTCCRLYTCGKRPHMKSFPGNSTRFAKPYQQPVQSIKTYPCRLRLLCSNCLNNVVNVVKRLLCKQRPLVGNARNIHARSNRTVFSMIRAAAIPGQRVGKHVPAMTDTNATIEERCFVCGPCRDIMSRTVWSNEFSCE